MRGYKGGERAKLRTLARRMRAATTRDPREVYPEMIALIDAM